MASEAPSGGDERPATVDELAAGFRRAFAPAAVRTRGCPGCGADVGMFAHVGARGMECPERRR